jgi:hypothetical protein
MQREPDDHDERNAGERDATPMAIESGPHSQACGLTPLMEGPPEGERHVLFWRRIT